MALITGRNVQVEISKTESTAKTVSAISKAKPPVISSTAHGLTNGTVGYLTNVTGMVTLEGQAVSVADKDVDTFKAEGLDSTNLPDFSGGSFIPVTAWASFGTLTNFEVTGGEGQEQDASTLHHALDQTMFAGLSPQVLNFQSLLDLPNGEAFQLLRDAARHGTPVVFRVTMPSGARVIARATPSMPGMSLGRGEIGTRSFTAAVVGEVLELAAVGS